MQGKNSLCKDCLSLHWLGGLEDNEVRGTMEEESWKALQSTRQREWRVISKCLNFKIPANFSSRKVKVQLPAQFAAGLNAENSLISKGIISNRQAEKTESSFHTQF